MGDIFRLDLEDHDDLYILGVLGVFLEEAPNRGRRMVEIRMRKVLFDRLAFQENGGHRTFRSVPVVVSDTGFDGTIEVVLAPLQ